MASIIIPGIDDEALRRARAEAEARGGSLEADLRAMIEERSRATEAARRARAEKAMAPMREYRERIFAKYGPMPNTTEWLREDRAAW